MKIIVIVITSLLCCITGSSQVVGQDSIKNDKYLRVYLDGAGDWDNYIRVKLWYVDYVRDPRSADVQVIITSQGTAAGGSEYKSEFRSIIYRIFR